MALGAEDAPGKYHNASAMLRGEEKHDEATEDHLGPYHQGADIADTSHAKSTR
jgi:hypothetical protein